MGSTMKKATCPAIIFIVAFIPLVLLQAGPWKNWHENQAFVPVDTARLTEFRGLDKRYYADGFEGCAQTTAESYQNTYTENNCPVQVGVSYVYDCIDCDGAGTNGQSVVYTDTDGTLHSPELDYQGDVLCGDQLKGQCHTNNGRAYCDVLQMNRRQCNRISEYFNQPPGRRLADAENWLRGCPKLIFAGKRLTAINLAVVRGPNGLNPAQSRQDD